MALENLLAPLIIRSSQLLLFFIIRRHLPRLLQLFPVFAAEESGEGVRMEHLGRAYLPEQKVEVDMYAVDRAKI